MGSMVSKRYFLHASGFDPYDAASQYRRFAREAARFATTWNVAAQVSALQQNGESGSRWRVTTRGPDWQVETAYMLLDWSDIVRSEIAPELCSDADYLKMRLGRMALMEPPNVTLPPAVVRPAERLTRYCESVATR